MKWREWRCSMRNIDVLFLFLLVSIQGKKVTVTIHIVIFLYRQKRRAYFKDCLTEVCVKQQRSVRWRCYARASRYRSFCVIRLQEISPFEVAVAGETSNEKDCYEFLCYNFCGSRYVDCSLENILASRWTKIIRLVLQDIDDRAWNNIHRCCYSDDSSPSIFAEQPWLNQDEEK